MKKVFLVILIISSLSAVQSFAEEKEILKKNEYSFIDNEYIFLDENYLKDMSIINLRVALLVDDDLYAEPENKYIAGLYFYGNKINKDNVKASKLFKSAAYKYFQPAQYMLGKMVLEGDTDIVSKDEAIYLLNVIKNDNYYEKKSLQVLADYYKSNKEYMNAFDYSMRLKVKETSIRMTEYAKKYGFKDYEPVEQDVSVKPITNEDVRNNLELAKIHLSEDSLDTKKSISLLEDLVLYGSDGESVSAAQTLIGDIYFNGNRQIYANHEKGIEYYKKASNNNYSDAMLKLHRIYLDNEIDNRYRLGSNKFEIHDLGEKIRKDLYIK